MRKENKKYETVLPERLEGKIDFIIEEQKIIKDSNEEMKDKFDSLENKVDSLVDDMDYVKSTLVDNKDKFKDVDKVEAGHEKRLAKLENVTLAKA